MPEKQAISDIRHLQHDSSERATKLLLELVHDKTATVRKAALRALQGREGEGIEATAITALNDDKATVRTEAARLLSRIGGKDSVAALTKLLTDQTLDAEERVFAQAAYKSIELRQSGNVEDISKRTLSVFEFNTYFNALVSQDTVRVEGEVSNYRPGENKWLFFDLNDDEAGSKTSCFGTMYDLYNSKISLVDGMKVLITGKPYISVKSGRFGIHIERIELTGEGALKRALELLYKKLETEGLFAPDRKRQLPAFPERVGLITSRDAAAYTDFIKVLKGRMGGIEINHFHAQVQGARAIDDIVSALRWFNERPREEQVELIVLTRGGGSLEDLHAFNSEEVARAIFASTIPVVCAVGHERDSSIADFVADRRASTPSNAAELIVRNKADVLRDVQFRVQTGNAWLTNKLRTYQHQVDRAVHTMQSYIQDKKTHLEGILKRFSVQFTTFELSLKEHQKTIADHERSILQTLRVHYAQAKDQLTAQRRLLTSFSPQHVLARGYSIVKISGKVIKSAVGVAAGDKLTIEPADGIINAQVTSTKLQTNDN